MNTLNIFATRTLLAVSLALFAAQAWAVDTFEQAGPISKIGSASLVVENQEYRVAPGAKLKSFDSSRRRLSDFKTGDVVIIQGKIIDDVYYVDMIIYHAPLAS